MKETDREKMKDVECDWVKEYDGEGENYKRWGLANDISSWLDTSKSNEM